MTQLAWMIYGAYGYTGELLAEEALRRGHRPLLAGRSAEKLEPIAKKLGLEWLVVDLNDVDRLAKALSGVKLALHAAGPFSRTSEAMVQACLKAGVHYLDVTGEVPVFANTFSHDAEAKARGVVLMSGVGFDVVPTDCLAAYVAKKLPNADTLEIAIAGLQSVSSGTAKSMLEGGLDGCLVRRDGKLTTQAFGRGAKDVRFDHGTRGVMPIPWGDLETAFASTGIPNITTYMTFPSSMIIGSKLTAPLNAVALPMLRGLLSRPSIKGFVERRLDRVKGPDETRRSGRHSHVWARATSADGKAVEAWLRTADGYTFTALAGIRIVEKVLAQNPKGALTPALAFGPDFVLEIEGSERFDALG